MKNANISRRSFLRQSALIAGAVAGFPYFARCASPNSMVQVAVIGVNGQGLSDLSEIGSHSKVKFVGFCDIDKKQFEKADAKFPNVRHFADYREMLSTLGGTCDAVQVSTPDHTHAPAAMTAMRLGKHVYCEKPLAHTVWEVRQMRLLAAKKGLITQMGNQIHSRMEYQLGARLLRDGAIGKIKEVHSHIGVSGLGYAGLSARPPEATVPEGVDWNLWIGTAPMRPYAADAYHPFKWRSWQDFGGGALGDFGCHVLDPVFMGLGLTAPISIRAEHENKSSELWPGPETVYYIFPGTPYTAGKEVAVTWRDGGLLPPLDSPFLPANFKLPKGSGGSLIIGENGAMLLPHWAKPRLYPENKFADFKYPEIESHSHYHAWIDGILANKQTSDGFHYAGPLAETVELGNVAARMSGKELKWDAQALKITNSSEANALITKSYRAGWEIKSA
jgi:predicted dehydrogenase